MTGAEAEFPELVKENVVMHEPLSVRVLLALCALTGGALLLAARLDHALPPARPATNTDSFSGQAAHDFLRNLTSIGPRVAGSYENEVRAVGALVAALRAAAAGAAPHSRVELDRHEAGGAFSLDFFDGMNNVYRGVQSVAARLRPAGAAPRHSQPALLLNCHFDTVPDSPGASDDGAGCAVLLEVLRALAAAPRALRRPVVFLFNGAEENIMQGSHAFVTTHPWARGVRAFLNLEACGAGGREVLFQAGPHDPWLVETYAGAVPHPYASSLAQELFESGLLPGDTDFRVFRDFGKLSGLDFAWSSNGYVYHTELDTADRVPPEALQRTGDNVLALTRGLLSSPELELPADESSRQPVFFDILGLVVVVARAPLALAAALAAAALALLNVHAHAHQARRELYVSAGAWWAGAARAARGVLLGGAAGALAAGAGALLLHAVGARLAYYSAAWLLGPLAGLPAIATMWLVVLRCGPGGAVGAAGRGWWRARCTRDACSLLSALLLLASACARVRSGYLPLLWTLPPALADRAALLLLPAEDRKRGSGMTASLRCALWALGAALPVLQTWYLLLALLTTLLPIAGRAGSPPLPADVLVSVVTGAMSLACASWLLPLLVATRRPHKLIWAALGVWALALALVASGALYAPYSAERPQRVMLFHVRRTLHAPLHAPQQAPPIEQNLFWVPELDANTERTLHEMAEKVGTTVRAMSVAECWQHVYCGAPYYLPVRRLVARAHWLPARAAPAARLAARLRLQPHDALSATLHVQLTGPNHVVVIVSPVAGTRLQRLAAAPAGGVLSPRRAAAWRERRRDTYFTSLFAAKPDSPASWNLTLLLVRDAPIAGDAHDGARWASLSLSGHDMSRTGGGAGAAGGGAGAAGGGAERAALAAAAPASSALTGWDVHTHLYVV